MGQANFGRPALKARETNSITIQMISRRNLRQSPPPSFSSNSRYKNQQELNDYLSALCKRGLYDEALRFFASLLTNPGLQLFPSTYARLSVACSVVKSLFHGRQLHRHLAKSNIPQNLILHNHILNMYGKLGSPDEARNLFDEMQERNLVSWTSLITGLSQNNREKEAVRLYPQMLQSEVNPDEFTLGSVLRSCAAIPDVDLGRQLHAQSLKLPSGNTTSVQNALIFMYCKSLRIPDAASVFSLIQKKDLISWGTMVSGYSQQAHPLLAIETFKKMLAEAQIPNEFLFGSIFSACGAVENLGYGQEIHALCLKRDLAKDACAGAAAADMYAKCDDLAAATKVFQRIRNPDTAAWNSIISAYAYSGKVNKAVDFFMKMMVSNSRPDDLTTRSLLCNLEFLVQGQLIHSLSVKFGFLPDLLVCNSLISMYGKFSGGINMSFQVFYEMEERDLVTWNSILSACLQENQFERVLGLVSPLILSGHKPDQITISTILAAASILGYLEFALQLHADAIKTGWEEDEALRKDFIDAYAKCGSPDEALKLFDLHSRRFQDSMPWSSLILGFGQSGQAQEALRLFDEMLRREIPPNHVTFVGVLSACSKAGLVEEAWRIFDAITRVHGVEKTREHYSCMVDVLSRAGYLREAEELLEGMPFEPDTVAWKTLLAACRARGDLGMAERAAGKVLELDPGNSAANVMLCGVYASKGRWEEVAGLRRRMRGGKVVKEPGKSWIRVNGTVSVFVVKDKMHPETNGIYSLLGFLQGDMGRSRVCEEDVITLDEL